MVWTLNPKSKFLLIAAVGVLGQSAFASDTTLKVREPNLQLPSLFEVPKVGIRVGYGTWSGGMVNAGIDVTFKVPALPIPALRVDAEVWSRLSDLGGSVRGNAISVLAMQTFTLAYAGLGPTYYFTSDHGDHRSGLGLKLLAGASWRNYYGEVSTMVGPTPTPVFFSVGVRF